MDAGAEGEVIAGVAPHVEAIGVGVVAFVAVSGPIDDEDAIASRDRRPARVVVLDGKTAEGADRWLQPERLVDGPRDQRGIRAHELPLRRVAPELEEEMAGREDGRVEAR